MKTPEEIKKGLECCILETDDTSLVDHCRACPYQPTGLCFRTLLKDALAYIQQLEAFAPPVTIGIAYVHKYCFRCGAKMDLEVRDNV